jgi:hypothetical protein
LCGSSCLRSTICSCASSFSGRGCGGGISRGTVGRCFNIIHTCGGATSGHCDEEHKCARSECGLFHVGNFLCWLKLQVLAKTAGALFIKQRTAAMKTTVFIIFCRHLATTWETA